MPNYKLSPSMVLVDTHRYEFEYGKLPSGFGSWAFQITNGDPTFFHCMKYGEAKRLAQNNAAIMGIGHISVCT
jgi:hypothetical protein